MNTNTTTTQPIYIFDFDSTFVQVETLEVLAEFALKDRQDKADVLKQIQDLTDLAMNGHYSFAESLKARFALIQPNSHHIQETIAYLQTQITPSIYRNKDFFRTNANHIYIISGGFADIIAPIVHEFGIKRSHILANRFIYDFEGHLLGYDEHHVLAQDQGKAKAVFQQNFKQDCVIIGDGYNDYEIKAAGLAKTFVAFTENVTREKVVQVADIVASDLEGFFLSCQIPYLHTRQSKKVLLLENIHSSVVQYFTKLGYDVITYPNALDEATLLDKIQDVHVLGIRSKTEITSRIIDNAKHLEAIGAFCIGTNQIDLAHCAQTGVAVFNAPFSNTRSVVELAVAEIIMLVRRAQAMSHLLMNQKWVKSSTGAHEVRGKTLGIVGYGHIGSQLSIIAEALGMRVMFYDIEDKLALGNAQPCSTLEALLSESDVVSIHVDGRPENKHFINDAAFQLMKTGAIFLNLSRGFIVDMAALIKHVESKKLGGVGIDVFPEEPHASASTFTHPLQAFDNVILTPHIGGSTEEAQTNIGEYVSRNLHSFVGEGTTLSSVNFPPLYLPTLHTTQRIVHIHANVPGVLARINQVFAHHHINIEGQFLKTSDKLGYVITDINQEIEPLMLAALQAITETIKVKVISKFG